MLDTGEASVKGALQRVRATLEARLPAADRERAPGPNSARERELVRALRRRQPAFGCYLPYAQAAIARPFGLIVLTLKGHTIAAMTFFADTAVFRHFGLPRTLPSL